MKKAFSIIEILVVLGLLAVVSAMGLAAFNIVQRNARDSDRKTALGEIAAKIEDHRKINKSFPQTASVVFGETSLQINSQNVLTLKGPAQSAVNTSVSRTKYYYEKTTAGFILCAKLESGSIHSAGNVKDGCVDKL